jgi:hypothetical protein
MTTVFGGGSGTMAVIGLAGTYADWCGDPQWRKPDFVTFPNQNALDLSPKLEERF